MEVRIVLDSSQCRHTVLLKCSAETLNPSRVRLRNNLAKDQGREVAIGISLVLPKVRSGDFIVFRGFQRFLSLL
jgi:hypothetical protein